MANSARRRSRFMFGESYAALVAVGRNTSANGQRSTVNEGHAGGAAGGGGGGDLREEAGAEALDLVRRVRAAGERLCLHRHHGDGQYVRLFLLDHLAAAGDRAAGADAGNDRIELAARVAQDLLSGRLAMD